MTVVFCLFHRMVIKNMPMGPFIDEFFSVAAQMNPLGLTDEEIGIFSATLLMCQGTAITLPKCILAYRLEWMYDSSFTCLVKLIK